MAEKPSVIQLAILLVAICGQKESVTVGLEAISKQTDGKRSFVRTMSLPG